MRKINAAENYLSYSGDVDYALEITKSLRNAFENSGNEIPKMLNDFIFNIEVELQNAGILDQDFNEVTE
jgi:hypothetical protein